MLNLEATNDNKKVILIFSNISTFFFQILLNLLVSLVVLGFELFNRRRIFYNNVLPMLYNVLPKPC